MLDTTRVVEQLAKARAFADEHGLRSQLEQQLKYLDEFGQGEDKDRTRCLLFPDFAPHSFGFRLEFKQKDGTYVDWMNGGLIFHGVGGGNGAAPEFSVSLVPQVGWAVHT